MSRDSNVITGVVLAGGRARRMGGQDKGLLTLAGQPLASHAVRRLSPQVSEVLISANRNLPAYEAFHCRVIRDRLGPYYGPLAGMLAAMNAVVTPLLLTVPCDSPWLPARYAQRMYAALLAHRAELSVAHDGQRLQPVFALLNTRLKASLQGYLEAGGRKIDRWYAAHTMALADFSDEPAMFRNINTPADLAAAADEIRAGPAPGQQADARITSVNSG